MDGWAGKQIDREIHRDQLFGVPYFHHTQATLKVEVPGLYKSTQ